MSTPVLKNILEAAMMAAGTPLSLERFQTLFDEEVMPSKEELRTALTELEQDLTGRGIELKQVASGYRLQVSGVTANHVARLWEEKPQRYTRALLETLALIAYRQPLTRGDIEDVRGVVVSSNTIKTLMERDWIRVVGHRDVPGRPAMYATTREFLDYFGLASLEELPSLAEIRELDDANRRLELGDDAEARKATPDSYSFTSDEEREERGATVLNDTSDDLEEAEALLRKVEDNVFEPVENKGEPRKVRDLSQILQRLEEQNRSAETEQDNNDSADESSGSETDGEDAVAESSVSDGIGSNDADTSQKDG